VPRLRHARRTANLHNLTNTPVTVGGETLAPDSQPLGCTDPLPAPIAESYLLVPACLAAAAEARSDVVWSASIPNCRDCAPVPSKRSWFAKLAHRQTQTTDPTLLVLEHYTPDHGRQGVGMEFFRRRYLQ